VPYVEPPAAVASLCLQPWAGYCCAAGNTCVRNNDWYYNCQPGNGGGGNSGGGGNGGGGNGGGSSPNDPSQYKPEPPVPARKVNGQYDYGQVLGLSFLFYEAQRSGKLPANNRIKWRGDSGLNQKAPDGRDVTGGWYDAGDNVKFNLPMAWSAGVIAWSLVDFKQGYVKAGQYQVALDNLKWVTDYFIKCVGNGDEVVVQVGNGAQDHSIWGRPEDVAGPVPVYTVTKERPGSDVVGAMGAALAAASVVFKTVDKAYSDKLLDAATKAYTFASKYPGSYSNSVSDAASFYRSTNYWDDVAFNALWLYQATGSEAYKKAGLDLFMKHYNTENGAGVWDNYDWDSNSWGCVVMLNRLYPNDAIVRSRMDGFIKSWTKGSNWVSFTPKGLAYSGPWGSLRHVGNALFLLKAYTAEANVSAAVKSEIDCAVRKQLNYILGDSGRSFVVGYGNNPPQRPHHRASSCPPLGVQCTWDYFNNPGPNPHTLYGALVGGPGAQDDYADARNDYIKNEVATDYNAGFTGALAAAEEGLTCNIARGNDNDSDAEQPQKQQQEQPQKPSAPVQVPAQPLKPAQPITPTQPARPGRRPSRRGDTRPRRRPSRRSERRRAGDRSHERSRPRRVRGDDSTHGPPGVVPT
jgi:endoglucanase